MHVTFCAPRLLPKLVPIRRTAMRDIGQFGAGDQASHSSGLRRVLVYVLVIAPETTRPALTPIRFCGIDILGPICGNPALRVGEANSAKAHLDGEVIFDTVFNPEITLR